MYVWKQLFIVAGICGATALAWMQFAPNAAPGVTQGSSQATGSRGGSRARISQVVVAEVTQVAAANRVVAIGTTEAAKSATIVSETAGVVSEIRFKAGDRVRTGDVIVQLDDADQSLAVKQARVAVGTAQDAAARYDRLSKSQAVPQIQAVEARAALATARNQLASAELGLSRRTLKAPFDGILGFAQVEAGNAISTTTPIVNIDDRSTVFVTFRVPERFAALVVPGRNVSATTAAYGAESFVGSVDAVDSRIDPVSRSLNVRARLPNADDRLRPGMAFSVTMEFDAPSHPAVPDIAVQWDRDGAYVWKVVDNRARRIRIEVVARTPGAVLLKGDIAPRDVVVAEGYEGLRENSEIAVRVGAPIKSRAGAAT